MRLIRAAEVPESPRDLVFRASRIHAVLLVVVCLAGCTAMIVYQWPGPRLAYIFSGLVLLLLYFLRGFVTSRFHPANWLVRVGDEGLFIHFRSYLNEHLSADDPTVVFLAYGEIRSARRVREYVRTPDIARPNTSETQIQRWMELELAIDTSSLVDALATECGRSAVPERRWYGTSATLYRDYPVQIDTAPVLRIQWRVVPGPGALLDALRSRRVEIAPKMVVSADFFDLQRLPREQQEKRLRQLDQRGETNTAVYMARRLYGGDATQAADLVKSLRGGRPTMADAPKS